MRSVIGSLLPILSLVVPLAKAVLAPPQALADADEDLARVRAEITERFPQLDWESINEGPIPGGLRDPAGRAGGLRHHGRDRYLFQGELLLELETRPNLTSRQP